MGELSRRHCAPCNRETPPLTPAQVDALHTAVPDWDVRDGHLTREFKRANFADALDLVNRVGAVAEAEGHHPDLLLHGWNRVRVELSTHAIGGLSENDFILAARIDELLAAEER